MKRLFCPLFLVVALAGIAPAADSQPDWRVWTVTETRHVLRGDSPEQAQSVKLGAACNEWVSFQILLRSAVAVPGVRVLAGDLAGPGGAHLPAAAARLYRQHQLRLETGTHRNDAFRPDWYPDPLIPFEHPLPGQSLRNARFRAVPFDLPAHETHGFWVDLYVPAQAAAGDYHGAYRVTAADGRAVEIPVSLTVWNFTLPETPALVTAFGSPAQRMRDYYRQRAAAGIEQAPTDWAAVDEQGARLLRDHRCNATPPAEWLRPVGQPDGTFQIPTQHVSALRQFVDRYHVNALQTPHPASAVKDPEAEADKLRAWLAAFDRAAAELDRPGLVFFTYLKDEPNTLEDYRYVQTWGRAVRACRSVVQVLVVEQPWTEPGKGGADSAWGDLYGAVDIWCPLFSLHRPVPAASRQALGETLWAYTALCQGTPTPWWHIDFPLLNYRVSAWMAWRDQMKGLLYWGGMAYWKQVDDPWSQAPFYTGSGRPQQGAKGIVFHGEGSLVYPARAVGYDGIVPTVRLKALRDAIEDYDYLVLLRQRGKAEEADRIARRVAESWFQWARDPQVCEQARAELARLLETTAQPTSAPPAARRILFLGDSITYGGAYVEFFEFFLRTRFPEWQGEVLNLGLPSETVSGLSEPGHADGKFPRPDLHERLERVLAQTQPDLVIACYGMNDGIYLPLDAERFERFQRGLQRLREKVAAAGARMLHLTPPTFEPVARPNTPPPAHNYNEVLDRYSDWLLAQRARGWEVVDVHGPMNRHLAAHRQQAPNYHLAQDGVHPGETGHWLMTRALILHFGGPAELANLESGQALVAAVPKGREILDLIQRRQRLMRDAWLSQTGHQRPGLPTGLPLPTARAQAAKLDAELQALLAPVAASR